MSGNYLDNFIRKEDLEKIIKGSDFKVSGISSFRTPDGRVLKSLCWDNKPYLQLVKYSLMGGDIIILAYKQILETIPFETEKEISDTYADTIHFFAKVYSPIEKAMSKILSEKEIRVGLQRWMDSEKESYERVGLKRFFSQPELDDVAYMMTESSFVENASSRTLREEIAKNKFLISNGYFYDGIHLDILTSAPIEFVKRKINELIVAYREFNEKVIRIPEMIIYSGDPFGKPPAPLV